MHNDRLSLQKHLLRGITCWTLLGMFLSVANTIVGSIHENPLINWVHFYTGLLISIATEMNRREKTVCPTLTDHFPIIMPITLTGFPTPPQNKIQFRFRYRLHMNVYTCYDCDNHYTLWPISCYRPSFSHVNYQSKLCLVPGSRNDRRFSRKKSQCLHLSFIYPNLSHLNLLKSFNT